MKKDDENKKESIEYMIRTSDMFHESDYDRVEAQIEGHKYFLDKNLGISVSWDQAAYSWMSNVYLPISEMMETWTTQMSFPGRRRADVFFELCDHWFYLSLEKKADVAIDDAVLDYDANYGRSIGRMLARLFGRRRVA